MVFTVFHLTSEQSPLKQNSSLSLKNPIAVLVFVLLSVAMLSVYSEPKTPEPKILLNEMSEAGRSLNYDGVFIHCHDERIDTMRIIHKADKNAVYERLVSLTGEAREVIRSRGKVKYYFPEKKSVLVEKSRVEELISTYLPRPTQPISDFYNFEIVGQDRIAGRDAWIVNISPKDKYRYGYQVWVDKQSKLLLKSELKNQPGVILEQIIFTRLDVLDDIDGSLLKSSFATEGYTLHDNLKPVPISSKSGMKRWRTTWKPAGFMMSKYGRQAMGAGASLVEQLVYTDGLAVVSIFVEKVQGRHLEEPDTNISRVGSVNAYAFYIDDHRVTVIGEVPGETVRKMADHVEFIHQ